eukprot:SAG22_NODE_424_length_10663_cov_93.402026_14_plen_47_part_00
MTQGVSWNAHVTATYKKNKAKNSKYKFSQAMKDAKKTYKKKKSASK